MWEMLYFSRLKKTHNALLLLVITVVNQILPTFCTCTEDLNASFAAFLFHFGGWFKKREILHSILLPDTCVATSEPNSILKIWRKVFLDSQYLLMRVACYSERATFWNDCRLCFNKSFTQRGILATLILLDHSAKNFSICVWIGLSANAPLSSTKTLLPWIVLLTPHSVF